MSGISGSWLNPLPLALVPTSDPDSFKDFPEGVTGIPLPGHPGAFGAVRKHHVHEGVDLYCPPRTPVRAVQAGRVVARLPFTGPQVGSPWWQDTQAVLVEGASGVVVYGEIDPVATLALGAGIVAGDLIGHVIPVLTKDKGRPMTMLHLELHRPGTRDVVGWDVGAPCPPTLRDPTPHLLAISK